MKHVWASYSATILLLSLFAGLFGWFSSSSFSTNQQTVSPLPDFLTLFKNSQVSTLTIVLPPLVQAEVKGLKSFQISAKSALLYDVSSKKTIYSKNELERLPMASLTKVMTAIIALENGNPSDLYTVTRENLVGEDSLGLTTGEILSMEELLYGLMLVSGNDAAEVLASNTPFGRDGFVQAMNNKAKALGLSNTNFSNPTGLQGDGNQYTTAYDLLVITNYALSKFPLFREIAQTPYYHIPYTDAHKEFYLDNATNLLTSYPGVKGVKTGYTPQAGLCLISYFEYKNHKIIGILLGSSNRREEMKELLDYSKTVLN